MRNSALLVVIPLALLLAGCLGRGAPPPDIRVPLPDPPARILVRCEFPKVYAGQDAVQALYDSRAALKVCEGKRAGWQRFYKVVRDKR